MYQFLNRMKNIKVKVYISLLKAYRKKASVIQSNKNERQSSKKKMLSHFLIT